VSAAAARKGTRLGAGALQFTFDGRPLPGQQGDTAASALLANGVRAMGRSMNDCFGAIGDVARGKDATGACGQSFFID